MTRPGDELLSAYFDGELAPAERAAVAALLRDSPAALAELDEIARLSELLHELPAEPAPQSLRPSVLDRMETATAAAPRAVSRSRWILALSGLALAALAMLTVSQWTTDEPRSVAVRGTDFDTADSAMDMAAAPEGTSGAPAGAELGMASENGPHATHFERETVGGFGGASAETDGALAMRKAAVASAPADGVVLGEQAVRLKRLPQVGEILRLTGGDAARVAVVEVTVVDQREGLEGLQLLLAAHSIPPRRDGNKQGGKQSAASPGEDREGELWAVYVQATDEALAASLAAMQDRKLFRDVQLTDALPLDSLGAEPGFAVADSNGVAVQMNPPQPTDLVAPPARRIAPAVADRAGDAEPDGQPKDEKIAGYQIALRGQPSRNGRDSALADAMPNRFHAELKDPAPAIAADKKPRTEFEPSDAPGRIARPAAIATGTGTARAGREPRLVRVLFVLRTDAATDHR